MIRQKANSGREEGRKDIKIREISRRKIRRFDPILKEIITGAIGKILFLATGEKLKGKVKVLPEEIRLVKVLRPDILLEIDGKIIHIEIQVQQDKTLPERMLKYSIAIKEKFGEFPIGIVLFVGKGKPPSCVFRTEFTQHKFIVLDIKKIKPDFFLNSRNPNEVILAILCGEEKEKAQIFREVIKKLSKIVNKSEELIKYMERINIFAGLIAIEKEIKLDLEAMPIQIDITKTPFYRLGEKKVLKKGNEKGLKKEFWGLFKQSLVVGRQN